MGKLTQANRKWWVLAAMTTSVSMIFIDITVLPVALPTLQRDLNVSSLGLQWVLNAYTLVLAVLVLAGGKVGDIWGLKKTFCLGVSVFAFSSFLCGLSFSEWWLIICRGLQGVGGALLLPATQGIIISHFPPRERGKAIGLFVSIGSIFLALGPLIGGSLTTYLSWRYVFWINLPIAAIGLLMALIIVPAMPGRKERFDWRGFFILSVGLTCLVVAVMQAQMWGWASLQTLTLLCIAAIAFYLLFRRKHKPHASIIDFGLIKTRSFFSSACCIFITQFLIMITVFWAIFFQNILEFSASTAGIFAFIANAPVLFAAPLAGLLVDRLGPRLPVMLGFGLISGSLAWLWAFYPKENIWLLMPALIPFGCGIPMVFTPTIVSLMNGVPAEKRGVASGINTALRQFSATLGVAIFGSLFYHLLTTRLTHFLQANPETQGAKAAQLEGVLSHSPLAEQALMGLPQDDVLYVFQTAKIAFLDGFSAINILAGCAAILGFFIAWKLLSNKPIHMEM